MQMYTATGAVLERQRARHVQTERHRKRRRAAHSHWAAAGAWSAGPAADEGDNILGILHAYATMDLGYAILHGLVHIVPSIKAPHTLGRSLQFSPFSSPEGILACAGHCKRNT